MGRAINEREQPVTEMAIVNTFTKLIFGDEAYTLCEQSIIDAFQTMDVSVISGSHTEMGEYLRNLGVREMIQLVSGLQQNLSSCSKALPRAMHKKEAVSSRAD